MKQKEMAHTSFPLGAFTKEKAREIAKDSEKNEICVTEVDSISPKTVLRTIRRRIFQPFDDLLLRLHLRSHRTPHRTRPGGICHSQPTPRSVAAHRERHPSPARQRHLHLYRHQRHPHQLGHGSHSGQTIDQ